MATYLLTWNPRRWDWEDLAEDAAKVRAGEAVEGAWSTGVSRRIRGGDRLFLFRQGIAPRGILGSAWATSGSYQDEHWDPDHARERKLANYVRLEWDALLNPVNEPVFQPPAKGELSRVHWNTKTGGIRIADDAADVLEKRWSNHLRSLGLSKLRPPGDDHELSAFEGAGRRYFIVHRHRERLLRERRIAQVLELHGRLKCEVPDCGFDFAQAYGDLGVGFAHVHHLRPLADRSAPEKTRLEDLAIVCANCHSMIHRGGDCRPLEGLVAAGVPRRTA